jgi:GT2 family glycosyltransferase
VRIVGQPERRGGPSNKHHGAECARGDVLVFLDGHCKPEADAIARLVDGIDTLGGTALVMPRVPTLDVERWKNDLVKLGQGYRLDLETFASEWIHTQELRRYAQCSERVFYLQPALNGCCFGISRELYKSLGGFDTGMKMWGVEDLDLGLRAWLSGHPIVQDPEAYIGHRFQTEFSYSVPLEHVVANALRMARKNFDDETWRDWLERYRQRRPEWPWDAAWSIFEEGGTSLERARDYLWSRRVHDEYWYAAEFDVGWPLGLLARQPRPDTRSDNTIGSNGRTGNHGSNSANEANTNGCDHRRGLWIEHLRRPRNYGAAADAPISVSTRTADGATLTLFLKLMRTGRVVEVDLVTFETEWGDPALPYASLLTQRATGRALSDVRTIRAEQLAGAFGTGDDDVQIAKPVVEAWQKCLALI